MYRTSFKFGAVVVIESLPSEEEQTGQWLCDTVLQPLANERSFNALHYIVADSSELFGVLASVERLILEAGLSPIVHFETHGTTDGIQLANRELVPWKAIRPSLTAMNRGCRMNLLAVMGMCHGRHLISLLEPSDVAPVWGVIGPCNEVFPARLQEAFELFYQELFAAQDGRSALQAMNARHGSGTWDLNIDTAELMYCQIFRQYVKVKCSPAAFEARENELVAQLMRQFNYDITRVMYARGLVKEWLSDHAQRFEESRRSFLMLDLFPENETRFPIRYRDCLVEPEQGAETVEPRLDRPLNVRRRSSVRRTA